MSWLLKDGLEVSDIGEYSKDIPEFKYYRKVLRIMYLFSAIQLLTACYLFIIIITLLKTGSWNTALVGLLLSV